MSKTRDFNGEFYQMFKELIFQGSWLTAVKGILDQTWTQWFFNHQYPQHRAGLQEQREASPKAGT